MRLDTPYPILLSRPCYDLIGPADIALIIRFFISWSYRPDIDIRFLTEELGFESDTECVQFLCDNGAQDLIEQKSDDKGVPRTIRFQTTKALSIFEDMKRTAFKKVDIKGQL